MSKKRLDMKNAESKKENKRKRKGFLYYFTSGMISGWLSRLSDAVYSSLANGLFGKIFTSFSSEQAKLDNGYVSGYLFGSGRLHGSMRVVRGKISENFEESFFLGVLRRINRKLLSTPLKVYGNYFLTFGLYTIFSYLVRQILDLFEAPSIEDLIIGAVIVLVSIPLLTSKVSLARSIGSGRIPRSIFESAFGFRDESFDVRPKRSKTRANIAIILGMISGILTLWVSPLEILASLAALVSVILIVITPEIGVVTSIFLIPFYSFSDNPSILLAGILSVTIFGYAVKLIRGKRVINFDILDVSVSVFMALILISGVISVGGVASLNEALLCCLLMTVYFLVVNMMRTEAWIKRCAMALVLSATAVSVVGIFEYILGNASTAWLDTAYFSDIKGRVVSLFDNSNVLGFYLAMIFPFSLDLLSRCKNKREKFWAGLATVSILVCTVLTWSRGAWIAVIVSSLLYMLIKSKKTLKAVFAFCLTIPLLSIILPDSVVKRFMSIGDIADSSTFYRVYTWKGSIRALLDNMWGGVGYGTSAFSEIYPIYAYAGIEAAVHSHNLYLQIAISMGISGLVVFLVISLLFVQKNFEYFKSCQGRETFGITAAALSAFAAGAVMGLFDYIWYSNRIFFLFWAVMGISCAAIRVEKTKADKNGVSEKNSNTSAFTDF